NASWAITATLLAGAVATPVLGRLGDLYGKRRMLLVSAGSLVGGSLLCALSSTLVPAVAGRALQGVGIAVIPLGISIMRDVLPPKRVLGGMAVMSASLGVGGALGLPLAAVLAEYTNWRVMFWLAAVLGLTFMVVVVRVVPESDVRATGGFDLLGAFGLSAGLLALMLAISKGTAWGWTSAATLSLIATAVVVLGLWGRWELRCAAPLVDLRTTVRRQVLLTNLASIVIGFTMYANALITSQLLQMPTETGHGLGQSVLSAGLLMAPGGVMMMLVSPLGARLSAVHGPKTSLLLGSVVIAIGYAMSFSLMGALVGVLLYSLVISTGVAFAFAAMPALIMAAVPQSEGAAANGLNSLMRSVGTSLASAVIGVVLAHMTISFGAGELPSLGGMKVGFALALGAAIVAALVSAAIPGRGAPDARGGVLVRRSQAPSPAAVPVPGARLAEPVAHQPVAHQPVAPRPVVASQ
nr:MFS transporter [Micromonospora sp. DSM 115978]